MIQAIRLHDFSMGHRVVNHEGKCKNIHGHNYRVTFHCSPSRGKLDDIGRVIDFGVMKKLLCQWLEENWDHKLILWEQDPLLNQLREIDPTVVAIPLNPTAENLAEYMLWTVGPQQLEGTGITLKQVTFEETRKCSATAER